MLLTATENTNVIRTNSQHLAYYPTRKLKGLWHSCQQRSTPSELNPPKSL